MPDVVYTVAADSQGAPRLSPSPPGGSFAAILEAWFTRLRKDVPNGVPGIDGSGRIVGTIVVRQGITADIADTVPALGEFQLDTTTGKLTLGDGETENQDLTPIGSGGGFGGRVVSVPAADGQSLNIKSLGAANKILVIDHMTTRLPADDERTYPINPTGMGAGEECVILFAATGNASGAGNKVTLDFYTEAASQTAIGTVTVPGDGSGMINFAQIQIAIPTDTQKIVSIRIMAVPDVIASGPATDSMIWLIQDIVGDATAIGVPV